MATQEDSIFNKDYNTFWKINKDHTKGLIIYFTRFFCQDIPDYIFPMKNKVNDIPKNNSQYHNC